MFVLDEEREIRRWKFREKAHWWEEVRWVQVAFMVRVSLEGSRLIDEGVIKIEEKDAVCL